jgi:crossover junction endodeoxyribonuclease RuvC
MPAMLVLGLDPGSRHTGYGLVERNGSVLCARAFGRFSPPPNLDLAARLALVTRELSALLDTWQPQAAALESPFHGRNIRSLVVLAQARGALLATLGERGVPTAEVTPAQVKAAVTGYGRAEKSQVARMVQILLALHGRPIAGDAADALAVAICYAQRQTATRLAS